MIKRFELADNAKELIDGYEHFRTGTASFINDKVVKWISKELCREISVYIGFSEDISEWNDFDFVIILDDSFCQPYTPFYSYMDGKIRPFSCLNEVIEKYNKFMSSLPFLKEIKNDSNKNT